MTPTKILHILYSSSFKTDAPVGNLIVQHWRSTHSEHSDESSLQQSNQYVAPVVFVVRHTCVSHIQRKRHQEELDGGSNQTRPLPLHSGLDIKLYTHTHTYTF